MRSVQSQDYIQIEQANSDFMSRVSSRVRSTGKDQNYVHNAIHQSKFKDPTSLIKAMYRGTEVCVSGSQTAWARSWQLTPYSDEGTMSGSIAPHPHMSWRRALRYRHLYPCFSTVMSAAVFPSLSMIKLP